MPVDIFCSDFFKFCFDTLNFFYIFTIKNYMLTNKEFKIRCFLLLFGGL